MGNFTYEIGGKFSYNPKNEVAVKKFFVGYLFATYLRFEVFQATAIPWFYWLHKRIMNHLFNDH